MKKYMIEYRLLVNGRKLYFQYVTKAICKLHALLKFKRKVKHKKELKREILKVGRYKNV